MFESLLQSLRMPPNPNDLSVLAAKSCTLSTQSNNDWLENSDNSRSEHHVLNYNMDHFLALLLRVSINYNIN